MTESIKIIIDKKEVIAEKEMTILEAAKNAGVYVPTLCYHEDLKPSGSCGLCVVEIQGQQIPKRSCCTSIENGMIITTNSKKLRDMRKSLLELILSDHDVSCPSCSANGKCELQILSELIGADTNKYAKIQSNEDLDESSVSVIRDPNKCIQCGRCITVCNEIQTVNAINFIDRGFQANVNTFFRKGLGESPCVNCGQCSAVCPTGAIRESNEIEGVWNSIFDPEKTVIVQEAPSVRVSIAEEFGMEPGQATPGKMYAALKKIGFDYVFDTNFAADLTILEEGSELVKRIKEGGSLPLITSCSPGWIKFMETNFPDYAQHISTCKSPQQMFGTLSKTYFAKEYGIDPSKIVSVSIMPCTAKKFEAKRPEMRDSGFQDVDFVLTTREFVKMIKEAGIDFKNIEPASADDLMGQYTGAGTIFGATGGVMEAAIRSAWFLLTGENMKDLDVKPIRGQEGIKEASITIPTKDFGELSIKVAVTHGLGNARRLLNKIREQLKNNGKSEYAFIEIMACPGGCVGGGGQPLGSTMAKKARRGEGLYAEDRSMAKRQSHENPAVMGAEGIYAKFLGEPLGELSHKLLHTNYFKRSPINGSCEEEITHKH